VVGVSGKDEVRIYDRRGKLVKKVEPPEPFQ
jgi:hypothetical protein